MKAVLAAVLLAATWAAGAPASLKGLQHIAIFGSDYVRLGEWAEANDFKMTWRKTNDSIELTGPSTSLRFTADSRKSQIDGINVLLSLPVLNRSGVAMISLTDLESALQPVLYPQKSRAHLHTICLDPGHGGTDTGDIDGNNIEKKYNLLLALETEKDLKEAGYKVVLTRDRDEAVSLEDRPALAARQGADLFISLHYNSDHSPGVRGVEVHCLPPPGMKASNGGNGRGADTGNAQDARNVLLAYEMQKAIVRTLALDDIGVKRSHFKVLSEARMPAVLIEGGFMTNPQDARKIYDAEFRQRMARTIVSGIQAYRDAIEEK